MTATQLTFIETPLPEYIPQQIDLLAAAIVRRAVMDARQRGGTDENGDPITHKERIGARHWLKTNLRVYMDVLAPDVNIPEEWR